MSQLALSGGPFGPNYQCFAVSTTNDPTGSYARYAYNFGSDLNDYPKIGVWPDAYYVTFNMFDGAGENANFIGPTVCAYDRAKMLSGQAATQQCFNTSNQFGGLLPSDLDGAQQPRGRAVQPDP